MDSLNELSSEVPKFENQQIKADDLKIGTIYPVVKIKQMQTRFGLCTSAVIKVQNSDESVDERILFLPSRLNKCFSQEVINSFNSQPESKYLKYLGSKKSYEGAKATQLFQFGVL